VNNKIYVGVHKTQNLEDGYMGSGKVLKYAIEKHGLENFRKDILEFFSNTEDMYAREKEIVTEEFLLREDVYNLRRGGHGGFDYINQMENQEFRKENGKKVAEYFWNNQECVNRNKNRMSTLAKKLHAEGKIKYDTFTGKTHSDETKLKIRLIHKNNCHQQGEKNSQYGKIWIYNLDTLENTKILKTDIIPSGWCKGRKPKQNTKILKIDIIPIGWSKEQNKKKEKVILDPKRNWSELQCLNCEIIFKACQRDIRKNRKFCSLSCCGEFKTKQKICSLTI
jgi:hypothetical protein